MLTNYQIDHLMSVRRQTRGATELTKAQHGRLNQLRKLIGKRPEAAFKTCGSYGNYPGLMYYRLEGKILRVDLRAATVSYRKAIPNKIKNMEKIR